MRWKTHGKYVKATRAKVRPVGACDYTGFLVDHKDLVPQMDYNGKGLYDTGLLVYKKFVSDPQPQHLAPKIYKDPKPVPTPRGAPWIFMPPLAPLTVDVTGLVVLNLTNEAPTYQLNTNFITITGTLDSDCNVGIVAIPMTYKVFNQTVPDNYTVYFGITGNGASFKPIPRVSSGVTVTCNGQTILINYD